ncbi:MAG: hypothetical protein HKP27_05645, partial [Myxococcales bacterium]|nr:hypothetical protein [Myxococcales bacterium]
VEAYGFVPRRLAPEETRGIHGVNERIAIGNLVLGVELLTEILLTLDRIERDERGEPEG